MHPNDILGLSPSLWVLMVTALLCGLFQYSLLKEIAQWRLTLFFIVLVCFGIVGGKVVSLSTRDWQLYDPLIREIGSGWRYAGVLAAFVLTLPWLQRLIVPTVPMGQLADILALTTALGVGLFRAHCFMLGCCTGHLWEYGLSYARGSTVWWHHYSDGLIAYDAPQSLPVIPLHLLFMVASFTVLAILLRKRDLPHGHLALWFLLLHEGAKAGLELLRPFQMPLFGISITVSVLAGLALWHINREQKKCFVFY